LENELGSIRNERDKLRQRPESVPDNSGLENKIRSSGNKIRTLQGELSGLRN